LIDIESFNKKKPETYREHKRISAVEKIQYLIFEDMVLPKKSISPKIATVMDVYQNVFRNVLYSSPENGIKILKIE